MSMLAQMPEGIESDTFSLKNQCYFLCPQILSLKDDIRRKDTSEAMEIVRLKKSVEEKDAQIQNLQGIREALDDANLKVRS